MIRGAVVSERTPGGFAAVYKVLSAFEDSGRCRRGYFVEGLGAAQFGTAGAIDRLRTFSEVDEQRQARRRCAWPPPTRPTPTAPRCPGPSGEATAATARAARPARWWSWSTASSPSTSSAAADPAHLDATTPTGSPRPPQSLAEAARRGSLGRLTVESADGAQLLGGGSTPLREALDARRLRGHPAGAEAEVVRRCLRATPSTAPPGCSTGT